MKFSNHWAPAEGHLYLWGTVRQGGMDLFLVASQEGSLRAALWKEVGPMGGSGCHFSSKQRPGVKDTVEIG